MSLSSTTARNDYVGAGSVGPYAYTFRAFAASDLEVTKRSIAGIETRLAYPADFTAAGIGNRAGGSITLATALAAGERLTIRRVPAITQLTDLRNAGAYFPETQEDALDRLTMIAQAQQDQLDRALTLPVSMAPGAASGVLPLPSPGQALFWNSAGTAIENRGLDGGAVPLPAQGRTVATLAEYLAHNVRFTVTDYAPPGVTITDGVGNATSAIVAAYEAAIAAGGGEVYFPPGRYRVVETGTVLLPVSVTDGFAAAPTALAYHFYLHDVTGVSFRGDGATIVSGVTSGGEVVLCDGVRDFTWDGIAIESAFEAAAGVVTVPGMNGLAFTATTRDSYNIRIAHYRATNTFASLYCFGDGAAAFRVRGIVADLEHDGGEYGIALHNNGDRVDVRARVTNINARPFFFYGVDQVDFDVRDDAGAGANSGFSALIKSYDRDTTNIRGRYRTARSTTVPKFILQSQHDPALQPTPGKLRNIAVDFSDLGTTGPSIEFEYFQNAALTAASANQLFDNVRLYGSCVNDVTTTVIQNPAVRSYLDVSGLRITAGALTIMRDKGFFSAPYATYAPLLSFGGGTAGIAYDGAVTAGEYYLEGNRVTVHVHLKLTSKGASAGIAQITTPLAPGSWFICDAVSCAVIGVSGMAGLTGPIVATITGNARVNLFMQGAAGLTALTDANFTNAAELRLSFSYLV